MSIEGKNQDTKHQFVSVFYFPDIFIFISIQGKDWKSKNQKILNLPRSCGMAENIFMSSVLSE